MKILSHHLTAFCLCLAIFIGGVVSTTAADAPPRKGTLRHVVAFKFKPAATPEQIKEVEEAFRALKTKVPGIQSLEWGTNVSPENRNKGFTHCFVLGFRSVKNRDGYLEHPAHKEFGKLLGPILDDVFVIDFWANH